MDRRLWVFPIGLCLATLPSYGWQQMADPPMDAVISELQGYRAEAVRAAGDTQLRIDNLKAIARGNPDQTGWLLGEFGPVNLVGVSVNNRVAGQVNSVDEWTSRMRNHGRVDSAYLQKIRQAMSAFRDDYDGLSRKLDGLAPQLRELGNLRESPECRGSETAACNAARRELQAREAPVRNALREAGIEFSRLPQTVTLDGPAPPPVECTSEKPEALRLDPGRSSAVAGEHVQMAVVAVSSSQRGAVVETDQEIDVTAEGGVLSQTTITVRAGSCAAPFNVTSPQPGDVEVKAKHQRLRPAVRKIGYCRVSPIARMWLAPNDRASTTADGVTPIAYRFKFLDSKGQLATDQTIKELKIDPPQIGVRSRKGAVNAPDTVAESECIAEEELRSTDVGSATIKASFRNQAPELQRFAFYFPVSGVLFWMMAGCGVLGAVLRVATPPYGGRLWVRRILAGVPTGVVCGLLFGGLAMLALLKWGTTPAPAAIWRDVMLGVSAFFGFLGLVGVERLLQDWVRGKKA
jgi:hypothetical protein